MLTDCHWGVDTGSPAVVTYSHRRTPRLRENAMTHTPRFDLIDWLIAFVAVAFLAVIL